MAANNFFLPPLVPPPDYTPRDATSATHSASSHTDPSWSHQHQAPYTGTTEDEEDDGSLGASPPAYSPPLASSGPANNTRSVFANSATQTAVDHTMTPSASGQGHHLPSRSASPPRPEPLLSPPASAQGTSNLTQSPSRSRPLPTSHTPRGLYTGSTNPLSPSSQPSALSSPTTQSSSSSSFFRNPIRSLRSHRQQRSSLKKVDYYESIYGFVPKNVMSEAEWRAARAAAPKEPFKFRARGGPLYGGASEK